MSPRHIIKNWVAPNGDAVTVFACTRGRKACRCGRRSTKLCDYALSGAKKGQTCDEPLCDKCAAHVGTNRDLCPAHARLETKKGTNEQ